jgi:uncharacterized membrane protein YphA (DoxX/SURF4 family)
MRVLRHFIAILRMLIGAGFVALGVAKLASAEFLYGGLLHAMEDAGRAFPFYGQFMWPHVVGHQTFFTYVVALGELSLGLSFVTGAFVSISSLAGAFMLLNYALATCYEAPARLTGHLAGAALLVLMGCLGAGLTWGVDRWLVNQLESGLVLLPLRWKVPAFQKF